MLPINATTRGVPHRSNLSTANYCQDEPADLFIAMPLDIVRIIVGHSSNFTRFCMARTCRLWAVKIHWELDYQLYQDAGYAESVEIMCLVRELALTDNIYDWEECLFLRGSRDAVDAYYQRFEFAPGHNYDHIATAAVDVITRAEHTEKSRAKLAWYWHTLCLREKSYDRRWNLRYTKIEIWMYLVRTGKTIPYDARLEINSGSSRRNDIVFEECFDAGNYEFLREYLVAIEEYQTNEFGARAIPYSFRRRCGNPTIRELWDPIMQEFGYVWPQIVEVMSFQEANAACGLDAYANGSHFERWLRFRE